MEIWDNFTSEFCLKIFGDIEELVIKTLSWDSGKKEKREKGGERTLFL